MKNAVFATARNEDQARKVVEHLRTIGISNQEISVILPHNVQQGQAAGQQPKKTTTPGDKSQTSSFGHSQPATGKSTTNFPNTNVSLKSLNISTNDIGKYESSLKAGQYFISVQAETDKLDKVIDLFKKEGLTNVSTNSEKAKTWH